MKIVQIGPYPLNACCSKGGVESSILGLATEQAKNHRVIAMDTPRADLVSDLAENMGSVTVFRFSTGGGNRSPLWAVRRVCAVVRSQRPDMCHIHTTSPFSFLIYLLARLSRLPAVVTVHGLAHVEQRNAWLEHRTFRNGMKYVGQSLVEFLFLSVCPVVIVDTDYVAATIRLYKKQWKIMRLPICKVIPQGVDAVFYQLENRSRKKQLLAVGAFSRRKGHLSLIAAMRWVKVRFPDFSLAIAGVVSDSEYYQAVKTSIHENECERNIHLHPNASSEELLRLYQDAGIFVLHSEEESQGIALCEAMAAGLPIVATNVGGVSCVVEDKVNGFLSDSGDIESFAENAINLLENDALAKRIGENNRVKSRRYDWRSLNAEIEEVYKFVTPKAARYPHGHHLDCL